MKALVTGGSGFIGSHLVDRLLSRGDEVLVLDVRPWDDQNYLWPHRDCPAFHYFADALENSGLIQYLVRESDTIYHLAAAVGLNNIIGELLNVIDVNVQGTRNVLDAAGRFGRRVLFASTSEIAGKSAELPFREDGIRVLGPTTIDRWVYSETKALGEYMCLGFARAGLPISIVRLFNVYGPRLDREGSGRVVTRFARQIMRGERVTVIGDGSQTRCFTYVSDIVTGILAAAESHDALGQVFNLGSEVETSVLELVQLVAHALGRTADVEHVALDQVYGPGYEDIPRRVPDVTRAKTVLGFKASTSLRDGLAETVAWLSSSSH
jgi:UDP-glucose 4-epimerase